MEPPRPTAHDPAPTAAEPPDPPLPPGPPTSPQQHHHLIGVLLGSGGTFLATLLGVGAAQWLADERRESGARDEYAQMVSLMRTDCVESLSENRQFDPTTAKRPLRQSALLYSAAFQNTLLFRFMGKDLLKSLTKAMSDAAWAEAAYSQALSIRTNLAYQPPPPPLYPAPSPPDLGPPLKEYLAAQERVCKWLEEADKLAQADR